jgi:hypothetical protein
LLDFGNADIVDIAGVTDGVLVVVQEVEEMMISDVNEAECTTQINVCPAFPIQNYFVCDANATP